jgi:hypothetical protein
MANKNTRIRLMPAVRVSSVLFPIASTEGGHAAHSLLKKKLRRFG